MNATTDTTLPVYVRGQGPAVVLLPAFGISPWAYEDTVKCVGRRNRVICVDWLRHRGLFTPERVIDAIIETLDQLGCEDFVLVGHSYTGSLALGLTARQPQRVRRLIMIGSAGLAKSWELAWHVRPGRWIARLATFRAAVGWMRGALRHPITAAQAGWHGFFHDTDHWARAVRDSGVPCNVLWAERDTLLPREHGESFARRIGASFTLVIDPHGDGPVDHDWPWRHPQLLEDHLQRLGEVGDHAGEISGRRVM